MSRLTLRIGFILVGSILSVTLQGCATSGQGGDKSGADMSAAEAAERGSEAWRAEDYEQAMTLLQRAAKAGDARAQYAVGYMLYAGQGRERDVESALKWIRQAADQGDQRAIEALGRIANGLSVQPGRPDESGKSDKQPSRPDDDGNATTTPAQVE